MNAIPGTYPELTLVLTECADLGNTEAQRTRRNQTPPNSDSNSYPLSLIHYSLFFFLISVSLCLCVSKNARTRETQRHREHGEISVHLNPNPIPTQISISILYPYPYPFSFSFSLCLCVSVFQKKHTPTNYSLVHAPSMQRNVEPFGFLSRKTLGSRDSRTAS